MKVSDMTYQIRSVFRYLFRAKYSGGHGVHSPFAFDKITNVFEETYPYYSYQPIEALRQVLKRSKETIEVTDFGTGKGGCRKVSEMARRSLKSARYAQLIHRVVHDVKATTMVELGTSLGITTAYLAASNKRGQILTFEGCPRTMNIAKRVNQTLRKSGVLSDNITYVVGNIDETLPKALQQIDRLDAVFFDANHTKKATLNYFYQCLPKISENAVFIFDDIHHSQQMEEAWEEIKNHEACRVAFDLYQLGIIYFSPKVQRGYYRYLFKN